MRCITFIDNFKKRTRINTLSNVIKRVLCMQLQNFLIFTLNVQLCLIEKKTSFMILDNGCKLTLQPS